MTIYRLTVTAMSLLVLLMLAVPSASSQTGAAFMTVETPGSNMDISIYIRLDAGSTWRMGMASFVFQFDTTAIAFESELAEGIWDNGQFPAAYGDQFSARYHHGTGQSIEIDFTGTAPGGIAVPQIPTLVGTLRFIVKDAGKNPAIHWSSKGTFVADDNGISRTASLTFTDPVVGGVEDEMLPEAFALEQNYPNPFNPSTTIRYALPNESKVTLEVFNIVGERIAVLVDKEQNAGYHSVEFDATSLSSGFYIYRLSTAQGGFVRKMLLLK